MKPKAVYWFFQQATIMLILSGTFLLFSSGLSSSRFTAMAAEVPQAASSTDDSTPAMVQRHIFSPGDETPAGKALGPHSEAAARLEKELLFTGVIHSPQGKWAIIRPKNKAKREDSSWRLREGDEIKGYHIEEIGANYIVLVKNGKPVRLGLYRGSKKRPAPPVEPLVPLTPIPTATAKYPGQRGVPKGAMVPSARSVPGRGTKNPAIRRRGSKSTATMSLQNENGNNAVPRQSNTSLADILRKARRNSPSEGAPPANPFSRIIQQSQGK